MTIKTKGRTGKKAHRKRESTKMRKSRKDKKSLRRRRKITIKNGKVFRGAKRLLPSEIANIVTNEFKIPKAEGSIEHFSKNEYISKIKQEFTQLNLKYDQIKLHVFIGEMGLCNYFANRLNEIHNHPLFRFSYMEDVFEEYILQIRKFDRDIIKSNEGFELMNEIVKIVKEFYPEIVDELNSTLRELFLYYQ